MEYDHDPLFDASGMFSECATNDHAADMFVQNFSPNNLESQSYIKQHMSSGIPLNLGDQTIQTLVDCTPDLMHNDHLAGSFAPSDVDSFYHTFSESPTSYLQYLKSYSPSQEPTASLSQPTPSSLFDGQSKSKTAPIDITSNLDYNYLCSTTMYSTKDTSNHWLYDLSEPFLSYQHAINDPTFTDPFLSQPSVAALPSNHTSSLPREFVSLSDVNAFVAETDSTQYAPFQASDFCYLDMEKKPTSTMTSTYSVPSSLALQTQAFAYSDYNDDSMDDNSDSDLSISTRSWVPGHFMNGWPNPSSMPSHSLPTTHTMPAISSLNNNNNHRAKPRKSLSTGYRNRTDTKSKTKQKQTKKRDNATAMRLKRFQSTPSGLSTLAGNTMRHSESISTFLARQRLSDEDSDDEPLQEEGDEDDAVKDDDDDDDDDSDEDAYTTRYNHRALNKTAKKSRNVDKACNHCKRSHLRCDNMRPCRRCVATGKTGCEDVDHKPRGRPRLQRPITT